jgi:photosystem II stability/assembly factor-like uncharacterized protein
MEMLKRDLFSCCLLVVALNSPLAQTTWSHSSTGLPATCFGNAFTESGGTVYAGIVDGAMAAYLYASSDQGVTWAMVPSSTAPPEPTINALTTFCGVMLAGSGGNGVYATANDGTTWTQDNQGLPAGVFANAFAEHGQVLYLGGTNAQMQPVLYARTSCASPWQAAALDGTNGGTVNALTSTGGTLLLGTGGSGVYRTSDPAAGWTAASNGLPATFFANALDVDAAGTVLLAGIDGAAQGRLYRSVDAGATWTEVSATGLPASAFNELIVVGSRVLLGTAGTGIYRCDDLAPVRPRATGRVPGPATCGVVCRVGFENVASGRWVALNGRWGSAGAWPAAAGLKLTPVSCDY